MDINSAIQIQQDPQDPQDLQHNQHYQQQILPINQSTNRSQHLQQQQQLLQPYQNQQQPQQQNSPQQLQLYQQMWAHPINNYYNPQQFNHQQQYPQQQHPQQQHNPSQLQMAAAHQFFNRNNPSSQQHITSQSLVSNVCEHYAKPPIQYQNPPSHAYEDNTPDAGSNKTYLTRQENKSVVSTPFLPAPRIQNCVRQSFSPLYETSPGDFSNNLPRIWPPTIPNNIPTQRQNYESLLQALYSNPSTAALEASNDTTRKRKRQQKNGTSPQGASVDMQLQLQIQKEITIAEQAMKDAISTRDQVKQRMELQQLLHNQQLETVSGLEQQKERYGTSDTDIFARLSEDIDQAMDDNDGNIDQAADDNINHLMTGLSINEDNSNQREDYAIKVAYTSLIKMVKRRRDRISSSIEKEQTEAQKILTEKNDAEAEYDRLTAETEAKEERYKIAVKAKEEHDQVIEQTRLAAIEQERQLLQRRVQQRRQQLLFLQQQRDLADKTAPVEAVARSRKAYVSRKEVEEDESWTEEHDAMLWRLQHEIGNK